MRPEAVVSCPGGLRYVTVFGIKQTDTARRKGLSSGYTIADPTLISQHEVIDQTPTPSNLHWQDEFYREIP